ncbi:hypothetical protein ACFO0S_01505 [Chryseomicrobium palamuruense]|uniref:Aerobactin siderophore biosynthesis IucA/IucC-like C-terminal domain-containing protein n=1 Tax=Chryseomicrobium palamuruense TaxID=682973 RepID=A0ABV8UTG0_9BACL
MREHLGVLQEITQAPHKTATAAYFTRRLGLFTSTQFWNYTLYDEYWSGTASEIHWIAVQEFGRLNVSAYIDESQFIVSPDERLRVIQSIWQLVTDTIESLSASPAIQRIHWENVFGYLIWHYHVFLQQPDIQAKALADWEVMQSPEAFQGENLFAAFTKGRSPGEMLNGVVRTTCCLAKDIPGQVTCGFCPLTN